MLPVVNRPKLSACVSCCLSIILELSLVLSTSGCGNNHALSFAQPVSPEIYEFGDSITYGDGATAGDGATSLALGYGNLMIADFAGHGMNFGVEGSSSADESDVMLKNYNPQSSNNPIVTSMIGTNDMNLYGLGYGAFQNDVAGLIEWATVPRNAKVFFTDAQCSSTGQWSNATAYGFPGGVEQSTTPASTFSCTIATKGPALYFGFMQDTAWTAGSMTILIDGAVPGSSATIGSKNYYGNLHTYKFTTVRYPLAAGSHTFKLTVAGVAGTTGTAAPVWLGSAAPVGTDMPPKLFVADVPVQAGDGNAAIIAAYNSAISADIAQLQADGLPVIHVQENVVAGGMSAASVTGWLNDGADFIGGVEASATCPASNNLPLHPGNCGHSHLRDAFEYYIQPGGQAGTANATRFRTR